MKEQIYRLELFQEHYMKYDYNIYIYVYIHRLVIFLCVPVFPKVSQSLVYIVYKKVKKLLFSRLLLEAP
jgi:hypothetical protein